MASWTLAARFNRKDYESITSRIYCATSDGYLIKGIAIEAIAVARHPKLGNLVLYNNNNQVTYDGPLD